MTQIAVGNQIWNYQEVGSGENVPILILHGWGRNGNEWQGLAQDLSEYSKRKVYVVDLPGFGGSSLPKVKNIYEYSRLVKDFCAYLSIERVILMGHSLGGRVGIVLGSDCPGLIERLILIDPAGVKPTSIKRVTLRLLAKLFAWVPYSLRSKIIGGVMDEDYRNTPALRSLYREVVSADLKQSLSRIMAETTVVWGEHDPILPLSLTKVYQNLLKQARIRVVWGADHDPHLSQYDQTLRILEECSE